MTHHDKGNYSAKHAPDSLLNKDIALEVEKKAAEGKITCADAESIATELNVPMGEVGVALDLMEIRLSKCQLGLFGFEPEKIIVKPAEEIDIDLERAIDDCLVDGRLPCQASWEIAWRFSIPRMDVSSACEALKIKIKPCQLGAF
jgi:hypothetical protein